MRSNLFRPFARGLLALALAATPPAAAARDAGEEPAGESPPPERTWSDEVVVTATRSARELGSLPVVTTVLGSEQIEAIPTYGLLDLLRQQNGLDLARGAGDLVAQPRDQGPSFRGLAGGTSGGRALALVDGLPLNDPYGGFVVWSRVPKELVERIEIVRGGGSSAWGSLALSGVVNLITRAPSAATWGATAKLGTKETRDLDLFYSDLGSRWSGWVSANSFDTAGYVDTLPALRTSIDEAKKRRYESISGRLGRSLSPRTSARLDAHHFSENRHQGTALNRDTTDESGFSATLDHARGSGGDWQVKLFYREIDTWSFNSAASAGRTVLTPNSRIPELPTEQAGGSVTWTSGSGGRHALSGGIDLQALAMTRIEDFGWNGERFTARQLTGGKQRRAGLFVQDSYVPSPRWTLSLGGRVDFVRTYGGRVERSSLLTGERLASEDVDDSSDAVLTPSAGFVFAASSTVRLRGAAYTGYRSPALFELFAAPFSTRPGRITVVNPALEPERLEGVETGVDYTPSRRLALRLTGFWNRVDNLTQQVIVGTTGATGEVIEPCGFVPARGECRQRRNLGEIRSAGLEIDGAWQPGERWNVTLGGALYDTEITDNPTNPALVGNRIPRAADQQVALGASYAHPRFATVHLRGRYVSDRYNNAESTEYLPSHVLFDLSLSRRLTSSWELFAGVENLLDRSYVTYYTSGVPEIGAPRLAHVGVRFRSGGR
jgi:outer membrane receptor protein involved in Fe transport